MGTRIHAARYARCPSGLGNTTIPKTMASGSGPVGITSSDKQSPSVGSSSSCVRDSTFLIAGSRSMSTPVRAPTGHAAPDGDASPVASLHPASGAAVIPVGRLSHALRTCMKEMRSPAGPRQRSGVQSGAPVGAALVQGAS